MGTLRHNLGSPGC